MQMQMQMQMQRSPSNPGNLQRSPSASSARMAPSPRLTANVFDAQIGRVESNAFPRQNATANAGRLCAATTPEISGQ